MLEVVCSAHTRTTEMQELIKKSWGTFVGDMVSAFNKRIPKLSKPHILTKQ